MALMSAPARARPRSQRPQGTQRSPRTHAAGIPAALRGLDLSVLLTVWMLCVLTDWDTTAKILLNAAAVVLLCLKELAVHRCLLRQGVPRSP